MRGGRLPRDVFGLREGMRRSMAKSEGEVNVTLVRREGREPHSKSLKESWLGRVSGARWLIRGGDRLRTSPKTGFVNGNDFGG
jgi:hypothetical protein